MKQVWAPWRMEYIKQDKSGECIFCVLPKANENKKNFILHQGETCFVIMNVYPYNTGHLMVSPYRHLSCITLLDEKESTELNGLTQKCVEILRTVKSPEGFNIGANLGKAGGAGFDEHIHMHIVPRWIGDTNYMPVLADTKVHPEHLKATYDNLLPHFKTLSQ